MDANFVSQYINHLSNALNLECNAHDSMVKLAWGIEANFSDDQVSFFNSVVVWDSLVIVEILLPNSSRGCSFTP